METFRTVRGVKDFLYEDAYSIYLLEEQARKIFRTYGYSEIRLPIIEDKFVFTRTLGDESDIVEKQIFNLLPLEKRLCLRPEATAQVARALISNNLLKNNETIKFFYVGPMFRGERPQKGRYRQFHHLGAEFVGLDNIWVDAEIIILSSELVKKLGIDSFNIEINTLGCKDDKNKLSELIKNKLSQVKKDLCENCLNRLEKNPLRVLDCKNPQCIEKVSTLKIANQHLCDNCRSEFKELQNILKSNLVNFTINHNLVRGLDYYTKTVFEIKSSKLGAQDALGAGGRYNDLIHELGGLNRPACGFALGAERLLLAKTTQSQLKPIDVFVAYTNKSLYNYAFEILLQLRKNEIAADIDFADKSLKAQLKYSQRLKTKTVVIVGDEEIKKNVLLVKFMDQSKQIEVEKDNLIDVIKERLTC